MNGNTLYYPENIEFCSDEDSRKLDLLLKIDELMDHGFRPPKHCSMKDSIEDLEFIHHKLTVEQQMERETDAKLETLKLFVVMMGFVDDKYDVFQTIDENHKDPAKRKLKPMFESLKKVLFASN
jgi:hypothetical protein